MKKLVLVLIIFTLVNIANMKTFLEIFDSEYNKKLQHVFYI